MRFPSKTFVLGEYSILRGGPALMLGHGPYFEATFDDQEKNPFHPESPAGKFCQKEILSGKMKFTDPHNGKGGFGCSGAEFLACWSLKHSANDRHTFAWGAWDASRQFPGSGADILTQAFGIDEIKPFFLQIDLPKRQLKKIEPSPMGFTLSLYRTGQKLPTHEHLKKLPEIPEKLAEITRQGVLAFQNQNKSAFISAIQFYGATLRELGLLSDFSRSALDKLPGTVHAAKGCGAMGADVLLVMHEQANLSSWEKEYALTRVAEINI